MKEILVLVSLEMALALCQRPDPPPRAEPCQQTEQSIPAKPAPQPPTR
jgi:hypothetical protein